MLAANFVIVLHNKYKLYLLYSSLREPINLALDLVALGGFVLCLLVDLILWLHSRKGVMYYFMDHCMFGSG